MHPTKKVKEFLPLLDDFFLSVTTCKIDIFLLNQEKKSLLKKKKSRKKFTSFIFILLKIIKLLNFVINNLS